MKPILGIIFLLVCIHAQAQTKDAVMACAAEKLHLKPEEAKPTVADIREENYDVKYVKLDIELNNLNTHISGLATTIVKSGIQNLSEYVFELIPECTVDSVKINGVAAPVTGTGLVRTVLLPVTAALNELFTVRVWYHGEPVDPNRGIRTQFHSGWQVWLTYTLSEPYSANNWWPCKQALKDKIDSSDVWITVPSGLKAGSNGLLQQVTAMPGGFARYEWKSRYPIDYYLISAAVGPYQDYSFYLHFDNSTDSMLVQNYIYDHPNALQSFKDQIDSTGLMINFYSGFLGRYPFWKEKYGHCLTTLGGGMEHQTMTTLGNFNYMLVAHELAHQWFGDNVTAASWNDIWLGEGFATYLAWMFMDYSRGNSVSFADMQYIHDEAMAEPGGSVYCTDTTDVGRIFSGRLTYNKGAAVIHSLRKLIHNDDVFFQLLKGYQQGYAGRTANTVQFKNFAESVTGIDLDTFFNQWIYGEGYPVYNVLWNQDINQVTVQLQQEGSMPSSVPFFKTPLEIKLYAAGLDTTVSVYNNADIQQFTFSWDRVVDSIELDPRNHIMNRTDSIKRDHSLNINGFDTNLFVVYPNPGTNYWFVDGMSRKSNLSLSDSRGRTVWHGNSGNYNAVKVDASLLSRGVYWLHISKEGKKSKALKLVKSE